MGIDVLFAVKSSKVAISVRRITPCEASRFDGPVFLRLGDAKERACRLAKGRRVLVERPNGTFAPQRCVG